MSHSSASSPLFRDSAITLFGYEQHSCLMVQHWMRWSRDLAIMQQVFVNHAGTTPYQTLQDSRSTYDNLLPEKRALTTYATAFLRTRTSKLQEQDREYQRKAFHTDYRRIMRSLCCCPTIGQNIVVNLHEHGLSQWMQAPHMHQLCSNIAARTGKTWDRCSIKSMASSPSRESDLSTHVN